MESDPIRRSGEFAKLCGPVKGFEDQDLRYSANQLNEWDVADPYGK